MLFPKKSGANAVVFATLLAAGKEGDPDGGAAKKSLGAFAGSEEDSDPGLPLPPVEGDWRAGRGTAME